MPKPNLFIYIRSQLKEQIERRSSKALRSTLVLLLGLVVTVTILSGIGTTCVALNAENYGVRMQALVPYKPLYQALVVISLAVGSWGIPVTIKLARGVSTAYRNGLLVLIIGGLSAGVQTAVSQSLRGSSAPVNIRFFLTILVLIIFGLYRLPPIWARVNFSRPADQHNSKPTLPGAALLLCGLIILTTPLWTGSTHVTSKGETWIQVLQTPLNTAAWAMMLTGIGLLIFALNPLGKLTPSAPSTDSSQPS